MTSNGGPPQRDLYRCIRLSETALRLPPLQTTSKCAWQHALLLLVLGKCGSQLKQRQLLNLKQKKSFCSFAFLAFNLMSFSPHGIFTLKDWLLI